MPPPRYSQEPERLGESDSYRLNDHVASDYRAGGVGQSVDQDILITNEPAPHDLNQITAASGSRGDALLSAPRAVSYSPITTGEQETKRTDASRLDLESRQLPQSIHPSVDCYTIATTGGTTSSPASANKFPQRLRKHFLISIAISCSVIGTVLVCVGTVLLVIGNDSGLQVRSQLFAIRLQA